jgi:hypothetical protein
MKYYITASICTMKTARSPSGIEDFSRLVAGASYKVVSGNYFPRTVPLRLHSNTMNGTGYFLKSR